jgi:hypothetical protein
MKNKRLISGGHLSSFVRFDFRGKQKKNWLGRGTVVVLKERALGSWRKTQLQKSITIIVSFTAGNSVTPVEIFPSHVESMPTSLYP